MPASPPTPVPLERTLIGTLGFELLEMGEEHARAQVAVTDAVRQPLGLVHGGVFAALAETLASAATYEAVAEYGQLAVGMSNNSTFLRPITEGTVHGEARRRHRGRTTWIWDVEITDDQGRLCAMSRVTMAVREARG